MIVVRYFMHFLNYEDNFFNFSKLCEAMTVTSDEFIFDTSEINISKEGNIIEATDGTVTTAEGNFIIKAKKFYYDKEKLILEASDKVEVNDSKNNILIKSNFIAYNNKKRLISSNKKSTIEDSFGNIFFIENLKQITTHLDNVSAGARVGAAA